MKVIEARNVHAAFPLALDYLFRNGVPRDSRNGPVLISPLPVTTCYLDPMERVLFWPARDANPFFHLFEALWMLAGRNDVKFLLQFAGQMKEYSDDGITLHGAYGYRWRRSKFDQLSYIVERLQENLDDRRQVLQMWDAREDLRFQKGMKDLPCNTQAYFQRGADGALDMMVTCRSNDIVWGCYGANAVHFSMLQEYLAAWIGCPVGHYWHVSFNWHGYLSTLEPLRELGTAAGDWIWSGPPANPYVQFDTVPLVDLPIRSWDEHLKSFLNWTLVPEDVGLKIEKSFFTKVAAPLWSGHHLYKTLKGEDRFTAALEAIDHCEALDWKRACREWIERRQVKWLAKQGGSEHAATVV